MSAAIPPAASVSTAASGDPAPVPAASGDPAPVPDDGGVRPLPDEQVVMDMAQILAHRIHSLLSSIEGFTDMLTDTLATPDQRDLALRILEGTARIERVVGELKMYSHPVESAAIPLVVGQVLDELVLVLDEADQERIGFEGAAAEATVEADPRLLRQALLVLVQNALEAAPAPARVRLVTRVLPEAVTFEVWNAGAIDVPEAEVRVFQPFYTTKAQNLGVGLSIARRIADAHGGTLRLAETGAEGTCFALTLPAGGE